MEGSVDVPHLSYERIRVFAEQFLAAHHSSGTIPVPIEQIVEFKLHLDIVPLPGLEDAFSVVGFTSSDLREISVDQHVYEHQPGRYRFTLAHEVGHVVLHAGLFKAHRFRGIEAWKRFLKELPELDYRWLEWQAYSFGGLVLVPAKALKRETQEAAAQVKAQSINAEYDFANALVIDMVATRFDVSSEVIERRLTYDKIDVTALLR